MKHISSRDNPTFKHLRALNEDARYRRASGRSLIDGDHLLTAALDATWPIARVVIQDLTASSERVLGLLRRLEVQGVAGDRLLVVPSALFNALSPVVTPSGVLAEIEVPVAAQVCDEAFDVMALSGIQDAGNLGSLLRTAAAAGIRQVWLDRQTTHAWSPKALRAGMGAQFELSVIESCDLDALLAARKQAVIVTSLGEGTVSLYEQDLKPPGIWVFGSEGQGVPPHLQDLATLKLKIPMPGQIESLNVGAAAAICLFEQVRQRTLA